jgi:hypothetical protein
MIGGGKYLMCSRGRGKMRTTENHQSVLMELIGLAGRN